MTAQRYNRREIEADRLRPEHIRALMLGRGQSLEAAVLSFQRRHDLLEDGKAGPKTLAVLVGGKKLPDRCWPLLSYQGRTPIITSPYGPRPSGFHHGADLFLPWNDDDPKDRTYGVRFRRGRRKGERWCWTPPECRVVVASAAGVVRLCGTRRNGYRYWIEHELGATGYLHLDEDTALVGQGAQLELGQPLAAIWDEIDPPHLHFEYLDTIAPYRPRDPGPWLESARVLSSPTVELLG